MEPIAIPTVSFLSSIGNRSKSVLNFLEVFDWISDYSSPAVDVFFEQPSNALCVQVTFGRSLEYQEIEVLCSGVVPQLLTSESIIFDRGDGISLVAHPLRDWFENTSTQNDITWNQIESGATTGRVTVVNPNWANSIPPEVSDLEKISDSLSSTGLGSPILTTPPFVRWRLPSGEKVIPIVSRLESQLGDTPYKSDQIFTFDGGQLVFAAYIGGHSIVNIASKGRVIKKETPRWLNLGTHHGGLSNVRIFVEAEWHDAEINADGSPVLGPAYSKLSTSIQNQVLTIIREDSGFNSWLRERETEYREQAALKLWERVQAVENGQFVYANNQALYRVPKNEHDVIILLGKLEDNPALPLNHLKVWEHTAKTGIDAIVDLQVKPGDEIDHLATMEIEFQFSNFIAHGHPPELTKYVLCWKVDNPTPSQGSLTRGDDSRPWLWRYHIDDRLLQVFEINRFPGLSVR
jgi:hypothetical protein